MVRNLYKKVGMTTCFDDTGRALGVTLLKLQPSKIIRHEKLPDGRMVVVVAYGDDKKPRAVHGWKVDDSNKFPVGNQLEMPQLKAGELIKASGCSKGKGFQDAMTRHNFSGGPGAHGSRFHRSTGSVGMRTQPGRIIRGKKLPGQHGNKRVTVRNLQIAYWSAEDSILAVVGGIPGAPGSKILI